MADVNVSIHRSHWYKIPEKARELFMRYAGSNPFGYPDAQGYVTVRMDEGRWQEVQEAMAKEGR